MQSRNSAKVAPLFQVGLLDPVGEGRNQAQSLGDSG
jgi:hypothetical protein